MRKAIFVFLVLVALGMGALGGRFFYRQWSTQAAVRNARKAIATSDYNQGLLWLRKAIAADARNVEAVRLLGDFADWSQAPTAVFWRQRLVELEPRSTTNLLLLTRAAVVQKDYVIAKQALDRVDSAGRKTAEYHKCASSFAIATGQSGEAEKSLAEAIRVDPRNPILRLNLALIHLRAGDPQVSVSARRTMEMLATNAEVRSEALRQLALDAIRLTNYARALSFSSELVEGTNFVLADRLLQLDSMRGAQSSLFTPTLTGVQHRAATNLPMAFEFGVWTFRTSGPLQTLAWMQTVPPNLRSNLPFSILVADCHMATTNWQSLEAQISTQNWGDLDYLRLAMSARALRGQHLDTASKAIWARAFAAGRARLERLKSLERLTSEWNWPTEREAVWWELVSKFSDQAAAEKLSRSLYFAGQTRSLLALYSWAVKADPSDLASKNNLAFIALLLDAREHRPNELAREVYEQEPDNPSFASTYGYSLYFQKKAKEARKVLDPLSLKLLRDPSLAGCYGVILAATGEPTKAQECLDLAAKGRFLPEEAALLQRARR